MPKYECCKCNSKVNSKCVNERSIFPENVMIGALSWLIDMKAEPKEQGFDIHLTIHAHSESNETDAIQYAFDFIKRNADELPQIFCSHEYYITDDSEQQECLFGCCY